MVAIHDGKEHDGKRHYFLAPGERFDLKKSAGELKAVQSRLTARRLVSPAPREVPDGPRPIAALDTLFIEEMTWMEVRDALKAGKTTVIVATGGVEQNGPYLATGKHNLILRPRPMRSPASSAMPWSRRSSHSSLRETSTHRPAT